MFVDNVDRLQFNKVFDKNLTELQKDILNSLSKEEVNFLILIKSQLFGPEPFKPVGPEQHELAAKKKKAIL